MASPLGRQLTDENRRNQALLGSIAAAQTLELATMIDPEDIVGTIEPWLEQMLGLAAITHLTGVRDASAYVRAYRIAELGGQAAARLPVITSRLDLAEATRSIIWAPRMAQAAINQRADPREAWETASRALVGRMSRDAQTPARNVVIDSADAAGSRWRRVSDGYPCAWCAMLVTRGPVYHTRATALGMHRYHDFCGCTAEEFFGDPDDWEPTSQEQAYIDLYATSTQTGMTGAQAAAAMREHGQDIINDAIKPKGADSAGAGGGGKKPPRIIVSASSGDRPKKPSAEGITDWNEYWAYEKLSDVLGGGTSSEGRSIRMLQGDYDIQSVVKKLVIGGVDENLVKSSVSSIWAKNFGGLESVGGYTKSDLKDDILAAAQWLNNQPVIRTTSPVYRGVADGYVTQLFDSFTSDANSAEAYGKIAQKKYGGDIVTVILEPGSLVISVPSTLGHDELLVAGNVTIVRNEGGVLHVRSD